MLDLLGHEGTSAAPNCHTHRHPRLPNDEVDAVAEPAFDIDAAEVFDQHRQHRDEVGWREAAHGQLPTEA